MSHSHSHCREDTLKGTSRHPQQKEVAWEMLCHVCVPPPRPPPHFLETLGVRVMLASECLSKLQSKVYQDGKTIPISSFLLN